MAHYDIFSAQLAIKYPAYGHALWVPRPVTRPERPCFPVEVGDVGFIREGRFHRLFNALLPADHPSHTRGVPEYHEPLVPSESDHIFGDTLSPTHYSSAGVDVVTDEPDISVRALGPDDLSRVSVLCRRKRVGAVLFVPVRAQRQDTLSRGDFAKWIVKHIESWFAFAQRLGFGIEQMEEIVLVTGRDRTKSWTNVAFLGCQAEAQVSFAFRVAEGPGDSIEWQVSPGQIGGAVLAQGPSGQNLPEDQCIFIRGFRASRTFKIFPKHIKAAAERPDGDEDGGTSDPETSEVISIPSVTKFQGPLQSLFEYVTERACASGCDTVLIHDEDLGLIRGTCDNDSPEIYQPEAMKSYLERSSQRIYKVSWDLSSSRDAEERVAKVAMLSYTSNKSRQAMSDHDTVNRTTSSNTHPLTTNDAPRLTIRSEGSQTPTREHTLPKPIPSILPRTPASRLTESASLGHHTGLKPPVVLPPPKAPRLTGEQSRLGPGSSHAYSPLLLPPSSVAPDLNHWTNQYCRLPGCRNKAYYDFADQEQTEYCGQGHELQAISTGLVNCCAMCKGRPRRTGERVCGRTCRERERQAAQVQGSYYGVPITRRECRIRPGESSQQPQPSGPSGHRESDAKGHMPFPESGPDSSFHQGDPIKSPAPYPSLVETATKVSPIFRDASSSPSPHGRTRHTRVIPRTPTVGPDQHHPEQQDPDGWGSYSSPHSGSQHYPGGFHNVTPSTSHLPLPRPPEYGRPLPLEGQDPHNDLFSRRYGPPQPLTYQARARGSESGGNFGSQSPDYPLGFESGGNRWVA